MTAKILHGCRRGDAFHDAEGEDTSQRVLSDHGRRNVGTVPRDVSGSLRIQNPRPSVLM